MQVTVTVSDAVVREASARGLQVSEFVEQLIDKGFASSRENSSVVSAIDRIRALRARPVGSGNA